MLIECPRCKARYQVADELIGAAGKKVRCGRCGTVWLAGAPPFAPPEEPLHWPEPPPRREGALEPAEAPAPPPAPHEAPARRGMGDVPAPRLEQAPTGEAAQARPRSLVLAALAGWVATVLVLGAAAWWALAHREAVIAAWPPSERVYLALGLGS